MGVSKMFINYIFILHQIYYTHTHTENYQLSPKKNGVSWLGFDGFIFLFKKQIGSQSSYKRRTAAAACPVGW